MSVEIIGNFTSNQNIDYLRDYLEENIKHGKAREVVLDSLTETVFAFPCNALLEDSQKNLRKSINIWEEVKRLNKLFIEDRLCFVRTFDTIGEESYSYKMFSEDSLYPEGYGHLNDERLFRYQDNSDINRSRIPQRNILNRGHTDYQNIDELRQSENSLQRHVKQKVDIKIPSGGIYNKPQWIDFD